MTKEDFEFLKGESTPEVEAFKDKIVEYLQSQPGYQLYKDSFCTTIGRRYYTYKEVENDEDRDWLGYEYRPGFNFER